MKEQRSKAPPVMLRDRWGTLQFQIKGRATRQLRGAKSLHRNLCLDNAFVLIDGHPEVQGLAHPASLLGRRSRQRHLISRRGSLLLIQRRLHCSYL